MRFFLVTLAALVAVSAALPAVPSYTVHEKRSSIPPRWTKRSRMELSARLPVRIGLQQRNLDRGHEYLDSVSNPVSKDYGKHWSIDDVRKAFAPSDESRDTVLQWLSQHGVSAVKNEGALHTFEINLSVAEVEELLQTEYYVYEHDEGAVHVACEEYSVPSHVSPHINIITPTLHFDVKPAKHVSKRGNLQNPADPITGSHPSHKLYEPSDSVEAVSASSDDDNDTATLQACLDAITPGCLRALYNIPANTNTPSPDNSFGIVEYSPNTYMPKDLDFFFGNYTPSAVGARPIGVAVAGGYLNQSEPTNFNLHGESNLDFQYAMSLTYPQNVTLYQIGGGDDSDSTDFIQTRVLSMSWSWTEHGLTPAYMHTLCNEYMKLGLQGVTILFSSGDSGVAGTGNNCPNGRFAPEFPASCPYITAVGATQLDTNNTDIAATLSAGGQPEVAIHSNVRSGGGFSDVFAIPTYQQAAVASYMASNPSPYTAAQYNNSGAARGLPDISVNGHNYAVFVGGVLRLVDGTSASAPVLGAMITLINERRLEAGKSSVGFVNPVLYQYADQYVKDVTSGSNSGCDTDGFAAVEGWDPVTGLGTPDFEALAKVFMSLD